MKKPSKKALFIRIVIVSTLAVGLIAGYIAYNLYSRVYDINTSFPEKESNYFYIHTGATYQEVFDSLTKQGFIINKNTFDWVAEKKNYKNLVKPGRYKIKGGMSNQQLINLLRSGNQTPIRITINTLRTKEKLAKLVGSKLETDSSEIIALLNNQEYLKQHNLTSDNVLCGILPNTYQFNWNTSAKEFFERMIKEQKKFWNKRRISKAKQLGFQPTDICVLASIVQSETNKKTEYGKVGQVYLNRLNLNMLLQADPTIIYAAQDFSIKRVLNRHKAIESPYNTYKYTGLPPGPIVLPQLEVIDSILYSTPNEYLFFCADPSLTGHHNFAITYNEHLANARKYQYTLDTAKIFK